MFIEHSLTNSSAANSGAGLPSIPCASYSDRSGWLHAVSDRKWGVGFKFSRSLRSLVPAPRAAVEQDLKSLVQRAFDLHQKGKFAEALPLLHRAYALEPDDYFVNLLLGNRLASHRTNRKAAVPFLKKASRLRPKEEFPLDYLGEAYARQEIYGEAAEAYIKAVRVAPGSAESSVAFVDFALTRFASMSGLMRSSRKGLAAEYRLRALALGEHDAQRLSLLQRAADLDPAAPGIWSDLALATLAAEQSQRMGAITLTRRWRRIPTIRQHGSRTHKWPRKNLTGGEPSQRLNSVAQRSPSAALPCDGRMAFATSASRGSRVVSGPAAKFFSCVREARKPRAILASDQGCVRTAPRLCSASKDGNK